MKERTVTHILQREKIQDIKIEGREGEHFYYRTLKKAICGRAGYFGYGRSIPKFYPNTCKHCIQAQITTHNRRLPDRDRRRIERRS